MRRDVVRAPLALLVVVLWVQSPLAGCGAADGRRATSGAADVVSATTDGAGTTGGDAAAPEDNETGTSDGTMGDDGAATGGSDADDTPGEDSTGAGTGGSDTGSDADGGVTDGGTDAVGTDGGDPGTDWPENWGAEFCSEAPTGVSKGYEIGDQLAQLQLVDCNGDDVWLSDFCGSTATWIFALHGW